MGDTPERTNQLTPLKRAYLALEEMRAKLDRVEREKTEPIAIIGMGCRFPGGATSLEAFWQVLHDGVDAIGPIPKERWNIDEYYDPDPDAPGKISTRWGGFLSDVDTFDASFFGIAPREAATMDPQQRLLLEVAWEALEHGGQDVKALAGSQAGVYIGIYNADYAELQQQYPERLDAYSATGTSNAFVAGRLSYLLNLRGPSVVVDTLCSSSLVAIHMATQGLRNRECNLALVGGVNLILSPTNYFPLSRWRMMAPDGRCKTFDASANGFVRSEGCGVVVLKRLSDAIKDGDPIQAVIRGTAVNQDGHSTGLTAPNGQSQQALIKTALANAGLTPEQIGYVEAHGTGTALGDPIEVDALSSIFSLRGSRPSQQTYLGSVKTNLGHLEAAAGMAGLIKVVLSMQHEAIPPNLHLQQLNPNISLDGSALRIPTELQPWPRGAEKRHAGISSFGFSGTNAHVIVEEAPSAPVSVETHDTDTSYVLTLSAHDMTALHAQARAYAQYLQVSDNSLADICYTSNLRHSHHQQRLAVAGNVKHDMVILLQAFSEGDTQPGLVAGSVPEEISHKIAYIFPGQGSQWVGMGRRLLEQEAVFRNSIEQCEEALRPFVDGWSLYQVLNAQDETDLLARIDVIQPSLFAMEVSLALLWQSWGITPAVVVGHSMGEVAAAHIAGVLSLQDAARIIAVRSRLMRRLSGRGAMLLVELPLEEARQRIAGLRDVAVAVSNSPRSTVLSGEPKTLARLLEQLQQEQLFSRWVKVDVASHSPQMEELRLELLRELEGVKPERGQVPMWSTVRGGYVQGEELDASYWMSNLREPVLFGQAIEHLVQQGLTAFLEISPHPILIPAIEEDVGSHGFCVASLYRYKDERTSMLTSLGAMYAHGYPVNWQQFYPETRHCVPLPPYQFQRQRYWIDTTIQKKTSQAVNSPADNVQAVQDVPSSEEKNVPVTFVQRHRALELDAQLELLAQHVQEQIRIVMGFERTLQLDRQRGLAAMGMDSLMAVQLRKRLEESLECQLPPTIAFDYPSIERMSRYLQQILSGSVSQPEALADQQPVTQSNEPIAIIGIGCRFPGDIDSPETFWHLLQQGYDTVQEVPAERWDSYEYYDPDAEQPGKMYTKQGAFLKDIDLFDPLFFGITPREAVGMDPQQRLLLEVTWEALERAGQNPQHLVNSRTGVFVGIVNNEYLQLQLKAATDPQHIDAYYGTGTTASIAAGRVSYILGLQGPTMVVDTACSSSLVSVHLASQSLRNGETDLALAGGVNLMLIPETSVFLSKLRALAQDGRCKTFDASADGYGRGEGCGMVVLKRLSDALRDGDPIVAVIRGTAVNHDGPSSGLTVPNGPAQQKLLRTALANAQVAPELVSYVEAHGTGTPLGDPIELQALGEVFGSVHPNEQPLVVGSVKTNFGHLEAAAGIAGLFKVVLALQHREIPAHLHLHTINPFIDLRSLNITIPTEPTPWQPEQDRFIAGVSAFGFSGTNAHVIVERALEPEQKFSAASQPPVNVLVLSAKTIEALGHLIERYETFLGAEEVPAWTAICATSQMGRSSFTHRVAVVASGTEQARERLRQVQQGRYPFGVVQHTRMPGAGPRPRIAFVCSGQGAQYRGMGRHLYEQSIVFRNALQRCNEVLSDALQPSLLQVLFGTSEEQALVDETRYTQPVLFAFEYALACWWQHLGVEPDVVLGHSVGEYVAAVLVGLLSLEEALRLIATRGQLMAEQTEAGAMLAVFAEASRVQEVLDAQAGQVSIAVYNGPQDLVLAGSPDEIAAVQERLEQAGLRVRRLAVSHAFHSPFMEPMLEVFGMAAEQCHFGSVNIPWISSHHGALLSEQEARQPQYWQRQVREPVRFDRAVETLQGQGVNLVVEIGPQATLSGLLAKQMGEQSWTVQASQRTSKGEWESLLEAVGQLYVHGVPLNWAGLYEGEVPGKVVLPTYPFQRQRYWVETRSTTKGGASVSDPLHTISWYRHTRDLAQTSIMQQTGWWLILDDQAELGRVIAQQLELRGEPCYIVAQQELAQGIHQPQAFQEIIARQTHYFQRQCVGVLYLWGMDTVSVTTQDVGTPDLLTAVQSPQESLLALIQALVTIEDQHPLRLWLVTRYAQAVTLEPEPVAIEQAMLWGIGRVIALEHPEIWGGLIDIDASNLQHNATEIVTEIMHATHDEQVVFRSGQRYVARLRKLQPAGAVRAIRSDGTYLITGGLGGLGRSVARWLVHQGARHLALLGRSKPDAETQQAINELTQQGAHVYVAQADVTDMAQLTGVFANLKQEMPGVIGILHLAASLDDGVLLQQNWQRFKTVLAPKVAGAWNLYALTHQCELDFFVFFSSAASVLGSPGQSNYAAANAFQDAFACWLRYQGVPAISINWGPWSDVGMATAVAAHNQRQWQALGVDFLKPEIAHQLLHRLLGQAQPVVIAMPVRWEKYVQRYADGHVPSLFAKVVEPASVSEGATLAQHTPPSRVQQLRSIELETRREMLATLVREQVLSVFGFPADYPLDSQQGLFDMGMDSLMSVELRNRLQQALECKLPATLTFDYPTIERVTDFIFTSFFVMEEAVQGKQPVTPGVAHEPIAIIGMGCRFPGGVDSPAAFWELLEQGIDAIRDVPADRWDKEAYYSEDADEPGKMYTSKGGFLDGIDLFDPGFFGIAPREAVGMDPQQRLLLEVAWEALENAAIPAEKLAESRTGVFVGIGNSDYLQLQMKAADHQRMELNTYSGTGNAFSIAAGRIAYVLGLHGPTIAIDTACSSALVAVHLACQSLRNGEAELALAGGVNAILTPELSVILSKTRALSPDGACKTFDASANGYVRGEGCGIIVLKRLSEAQRDGDPILGLIRGSAINHDGASSGLTVPSGPAQQAVLRAALQQAEVEAAQVQYVEAHGTGTPLGDPIEAQALGAVYGEQRPAEQPLWIGSVKSSIGHLEPAAGIAGLIKVVLCLQQEAIPPQQHFHQLNPLIEAERLQVAVVRQRTAWPRGEQVRVGGVSAFGLSGTNAHVLLQEAPLRELHVQVESRPQVGVLTLSAKTAEVLAQVVERYERWLGTTTEEWAAICSTSQMGRSSFAHRVAVIASGTAQARERLQQLQQGRHPFGVVQHMLTPGAGPRPRIAFVCSGQGAQYRGMGRHLYEQSIVFRNALQHCNEVLGEALQPSLLQVLFGTPEEQALVDETRYTQPVLFAFEYALAQWWQQLGVQPDVVLGHSVGEYVAAVLAGLLSLEEALRLITTRGRLMAEQTEPGAMLAVFAEAARAQELLDEQGGQVTIAVYNGPQDLVLSGSPAEIAEVQERLEQAGLRVRRLAVSHAFHSPLMEPMLEAFGMAAGQCHFGQMQLPWISSHHGHLLSEQEVRQPQYWQRQVREPVRFDRAVETLQAQGVDLILEIGPQATLSGLLAKQMVKQSWTVQASQRPSKGEWESLLEAVGQLYVHGVSLNWAALYEGVIPDKVVLPTYPFQRQRYWVDIPVPGTQAELNYLDAMEHPLIGRRIDSPTGEVRFETHLNGKSNHLLQDHILYGTLVVPGAYYISLLLIAAEQLLHTTHLACEDCNFYQAMTLFPDETRVMQLIFTPEEKSARWSFQIYSAELSEQEHQDAWVLHAGGVLLHDAYAEQNNTPLIFSHIQMRSVQELSGSKLYQMMREHEIELGPQFQWVEHLWQHKEDGLSRMRVETGGEKEQHYLLPPGLIDSCFQSIAACLPEGEHFSSVYIPLGIRRLTYSGLPFTTSWCHVHLEPVNDVNVETLAADVQLVNEQGQLVLEMQSLFVKHISRDAFLRATRKPMYDWFHTLQWVAADAPVSAEVEQSTGWLIFTDTPATGLPLARHLQKRGMVCQLVCTYEVHAPGIMNYQVADETVASYRDCLTAFKQLAQQCSQLAVVYLADAEVYATDAKHPGELQRQLCGHALHIVKALAQEYLPIPVRLWFVTRGAQAVSPENSAEQRLAVEQATLWGMGRVIAEELPDLWGGMIDSDPDTQEVDAEQLIAEIHNGTGEDQVAFRAGKRFVARLQRTSVRERIPVVPVSADGAYLITGGLGGLGLVLARWLAEQGAGCLVLLGRHAPSEQAGEQITAIEQLGTRVIAVQADVALVDDVQRVLGEIANSAYSLRGLIHAAGVLADGLLMQQSWEQFESVFAPKVTGTWNLHQLTKDMPLDFFICFSSAAALLGSIGQGNYAAANAFMDTLVHMRRTQGLPALSINWGLWADVGMAAAAAERGQEQWNAVGMGMIPLQQGLSALQMCITADVPALMVLPVKWQKFVARYNDRILPLYELLVQPERVHEAQQAVQQQIATSRPEILQQLEAVVPHQRKVLLQNHVEQQVLSVLGFDDAQILDLQQGLFHLGLDSLMAVDLKNRLQKTLQCKLPPTLTFDHPSIAAITDYLAKSVLHLEEESQVAPEQSLTEDELVNTTSTSRAQELGELSEDDLEELLLKKLEALEESRRLQ